MNFKFTLACVVPLPILLAAPPPELYFACAYNTASYAGYSRRHVFAVYHLTVLSAEQNDSQSEEINLIDESPAENRPVPVQEAEIRWEKVSLVGRYVCCA